MAKDIFGYSELLPEIIREPFMWLCQDVASLQQKWDFWQELFGKRQNAIFLSNLVPASFNIILETLQNDITMAIYRLSDPPRSMGQENLSFATLAKNCIEIEGLTDRISEFRRMCEPVRQRRKKRVGHRDLNSVINPLENPLPNISKDQIDMIINNASNILNFILKHYEDAEMYFHAACRGGAEELIFWLNEGNAAKSHTHARHGSPRPV